MSLAKRVLVGVALACWWPVSRAQEKSEGEIEDARLTRLPARLAAGRPASAVEFAITCRGRETQMLFNEAVAALHALDARTADRFFHEASLRERDCAMAWWGLAVANVENRVLARHYLTQALQRSAPTSAREQAWIAAWHGYLQEGAAELDRRRQLVEALNRMLAVAPEDREAAAFLLRQVLDNRAAGIPVPFLSALDALAERALAARPGHPLALYRLLLWEQEQPTRVAELARAVRRARADSPRALTAAGRIHARLGNLAEATECFAAAREWVRAHMADTRQGVLDFPGYVENADHLIAGLRTQGCVAEALALARHLIELPAVFQADETLPTVVAGMQMAAPSATAPFASGNAEAALVGQRHWIAILLECERWDELAAALRSPYFAVTGPESAGLRAHARGLAAFALGDDAAVGSLRDELEQLAAQMPAGGWHLADEAFRGRQRRLREMAGELTVGLDLARSSEAPRAARQAAANPATSPGLRSAIARRFPAEASGSHGGLPGTAGTESAGVSTEWMPPAAPAFSLPDHRGEPITLRSHAGRPLLLVFYRGAGCPHCIEQLRALAPLHKDFSEAGVAMLAVSTDSVAGLQETLSAVGAKAAVPFPLVSDQALAAFQVYGATDPRTGEAWHGVFLIDAHGRIVWRNVGAEPFMAVRTLLAEARRTLPLWAARRSPADGLVAPAP